MRTNPAARTRFQAVFFGFFFFRSARGHGERAG
ncbi:hypothetical protein dsat_2481 [Alkalidesulfovibrio alkalitolerans DSM 16529]|jgi:hypothetical protein|uniref:Uncharacterized protein n=1 Tax=Alkalidesulfovibrio alkalitolerans DSM 16529 TaxID=1121439 RepID=S7US34_9BACT|nr:hypothetical protein dsat_2481 [Alkalidesulfovibrio alkalitolerans DSM 16529]